jgi:alpha-tubulin suppressor-like RCC1 family protein
LNDPDDVDGDGWIDSDDPCLSGAERGSACLDPDLDGVAGIDELCPVGQIESQVFTAVTAGARHACALHRNGTVACVGLNTAGQLGDGTFTNQTAPVRVVGLGPPFTAPVVNVDAGDAHTCAVLSDGTARCWGENDFGRLGDGNSIGNVNRATPVVVTGLTNAVKVSAGVEATCALLADGGVKCWGRNSSSNALGDGTGIDRATPVSVLNISGAIDVSAGGGHACAVLSSGGVRCWGENDNGRLGDGNLAGNINRSSPVVVTGLTDAVRVVSGGSMTCALRTGGAVSCWGLNNVGQLGIGSTTESAVPAVVAVSGVSSLSASDTTCAVTAAGLSCWGQNSEGQFGVGTTTSSTSPVSVPLAADAVDVATGSGFTCMLDAAGAARCWGRNAEGELGSGDTAALTTVPSAGWSLFVRGSLVSDIDGDGCEDP